MHSLKTLLRHIRQILIAYALMCSSRNDGSRWTRIRSSCTISY